MSVDEELLDLLLEREIRVARLADHCSHLLANPPVVDVARVERLVLDLLAHDHEGSPPCDASGAASPS